MIPSHPSWVRELKPPPPSDLTCCHRSHPSWVRELKLDGGFVGGCRLVSHPSWVRELKHHYSSLRMA